MLSVTVKDNDREFRRIVKDLKKDPAVEVGFFAGKLFDEDGVDVVLKAWQNEFGTDRIPERSFIRSTIDENKKQIFKFMERQEKRLLLGKMTLAQYPETVALYAIGLIKKKIARSKEWAVANAPATIEAKGSDLPLTDTGQMKNSLDWQEVKK